MKLKKFIGILLSAVMLLSMFPLATASAYSKEQAALTFSDSGIAETSAGSGYSISGTTLTITAAGTYRVTGSCSEGNIVVGKGLKDVTLIFDNLTLSSSTTAPVVMKGSSATLLKLEGASTITDNEDASTEATNSDFEGAAIKFKSTSSLTIFGDGSLKAVGNAKNGIKGGAEATLTINSGTITASAANNAIASDGSVTINGGTFNVTADNDGIKSEPDEGDTDSAGTVTINGGSFDIHTQGDGIQAAEYLKITGGTFDIKTLDGYNSSSFNKETMSCKGIKSSGNNENAAAPTNMIEITGGTFNLNTADDAVHSDGYVTITGGTFNIYSGDDGVHADSTLTLGSESGYERDPEITIYSSYEGLEGSLVNVYSGKLYVTASDDGINAAGGSSNGTDPRQNGGGDSFRPGGRPGGQQGGQPGAQGSSDYSLNIYGGSLYVNCDGDGLDSNGALNLLGGTVTVLSMRSGGDNSPIDSDSTITINGATVFAAGSRGMGVNLSQSSQKSYTDSTSRNANTVVNVNVNNSTVYSEKLTKNINYLLYSSPEMTSNSASISTGSSVDSCKSNSWQHNWDNGSVEKAATDTESGVIKYTCSDCNAVERKTVPATTAVTEYTEEDATQAVTENTTVYTASFVTDSHATVNVYYKQDYTAPDETGATTAIARASDTGLSDGTGSGQINFAVAVEDGYKVDSVTVDGTYNNLKNISLSELIDNLYRITKVGSDLTVTITTAEVDGTEEADKGYNVSFVTDGNASIDVYNTQDYTEASETDVTTAVSRNSTSGVPDSTGEGQVNFKVVTAQGYEVDAVTVDGSYKNLKTPVDTGVENVYRITKVAGDLTITVTTKQSSTEAQETTAPQETTEPQETTIPQETTAPQETTEPQETTVPQTTTEPQETTAPQSTDPTSVVTEPTQKTAQTSKTTAKKANTVKVKAKTVKAKAKKKTVIKKTKAFKITGAVGKVTFKKLSGSKKITITKAGKITVKKGLKKGKTYKLKVKIYVKGNSKYKSKTITKTIKIKIK